MNMYTTIDAIPQQLGQYLYQYIDQAWFEAELILEQTETTYDCWAYYFPMEAPLEQIDISVSDDIAALFKLLYDHGINSQPEQWQRVIFSIKPNGQFSINFEKDNDDEG